MVMADMTDLPTTLNLDQHLPYLLLSYPTLPYQLPTYSLPPYLHIPSHCSPPHDQCQYTSQH